MHAALLSLALLASAPADGDLVVTSDDLGVTLRCPRAVCAKDAGFEWDAADNHLFYGADVFSAAEVVDFAPERSLADAYAGEDAYLSRFFTLSYKRIKPGAFAVLSGLGRGKDGDKVVYEKVIRGKKSLIGLRLVYPTARKAELDSVVAGMMASFAPTAGSGFRVTAKQAVAMVSELPEVRAVEKSGRRLAAEQKSHFFVALDYDSQPSPEAKPGSKEARWEIMVGYSHHDDGSEGGAAREERVLDFRVDAFTGQIFGYDIVCDFTLSLERYRQLNKGEIGTGEKDCDSFQKYAQ
jgi:hypothetical protein